MSAAFQPALAGVFSLKTDSCQNKKSEDQIRQIRRDFYVSNVKKYLERLSSWDAVAFFISVLAFGGAVLAMVLQDNDWYYPLHMTLVQYYRRDDMPPAVTEFVAEINQCANHKITLDGGPTAEWSGQQFDMLYYPHPSGSFSPWPATISVLALTCVMVLLRWMLSVNGIGIPLYLPVGPCFFRWLEYLITSPIMIVIIAVAAGVRQVPTLTLLGVVQAVLIMMGYLTELLIGELWDEYFYLLLAEVDQDVNVAVAQVVMSASVRSSGTPQFNDSVSSSRSSKSEQQTLDQEEEGSDTDESVGEREVWARLPGAWMLHKLLVPAYNVDVLTHVNSICAFEYKSRQPLLEFRLIVSLFISWLAFAVQWWIIISALGNATATFNACSNSDLQVPGIVTAFVWIEAFLFALFGIVQTWQMLQAWMICKHGLEDLQDQAVSQASSNDDIQQALIKNSSSSFDKLKKNVQTYHKKFTYNFLRATLYYTWLNTIAKLFLGICIIIISTDLSSGN